MTEYEYEREYEPEYQHEAEHDAEGDGLLSPYDATDPEDVERFGRDLTAEVERLGGPDLDPELRDQTGRLGEGALAVAQGRRELACGQGSGPNRLVERA